ncbi:hypothetical protein [Photobacterium phosphoreum]|uniref:hypothetical protein n=1 Tax=Photobacterium phosphoreum TaxID=659 RepID=UPI0007F87699|nr:hypothetical protein [Photobacterium phosphoreum]OBU37896.1 hypothetical protein AYY24_01215 [Photobacterium phosphoreum]PSW38959.1 hypothetical protein CTM87_01325 [Photobacterium phosphoreum]
MSEITQELSSSSQKSDIGPSLSIGGVSAILIVLLNSIVIPEFLPSLEESKDVLASIVPLVVGLVFWSSQVFFAWFGYGTIAELKIEKKLDKKIKFLEKRLKEAKVNKRSPESILNLEKQLQSVEEARAKIS